MPKKKTETTTEGTHTPLEKGQLLFTVEDTDFEFVKMLETRANGEVLVLA